MARAAVWVAIVLVVSPQGSCCFDAAEAKPLVSQEMCNAVNKATAHIDRELKRPSLFILFFLQVTASQMSGMDSEGKIKY